MSDVEPLPMTPIVDPATDTLGATMQEIFDELPARLGITQILQDALPRIDAAIPADYAARGELLKQRVADVFQEITTHVGGEYTRRTGRTFAWVDEPAFEPDDNNVVMGFHTGMDGTVGIGEATPMTFFDWLRLRCGEESTVGDLARAVEEQVLRVALPAPFTPRALLHHLQQQEASAERCNAVRLAAIRYGEPLVDEESAT